MKVNPVIHIMSGRVLAVIFFSSCCFWIARSQKFIWKRCPNKICFCRNNGTNILMKCTDRNFSATAIPPPPSNQGVPYDLYLTLNHNRLSLTNNTFSNFQKVSLVSIIFFVNRIYSVAADTFSGLSRLEEVVFSGRGINVSVLSDTMVSLRSLPLKILTISNTRLKGLPSTFFTPLANLTNLTLSLVNNHFTTYVGELYEPLKGLVYLNLRSNRISAMNMSDNYIQNLTHLRLDVNRLEAFPPLCVNKRKSHFPQLTILQMEFNHLPFLVKENYNCLQKLQKFFLNGNLIAELKKEQFSDLKSLEVLKLSYIGYSLRKVHPQALHSTSLRKLYFRKNMIEFGRNDKSISFDIFSWCPSLELLNINFNVFSYLREGDYDNVFRNLTSLNLLIMGGGGLKFIPKALTHHLKNLTSLALYHNEIKDIPSHFNSLAHLKKLYLGNNEITSVKEKHIPSSIFLKNGTGYIDLSANPLSCGCESLWLIQTLQRYPYSFRTKWHKNGYLCHSPLKLSGTSLEHVPISVQKCLLSWNALMIVLVGSSVLITLLLVTSLMYYFRWNLMYLLFMMRHKERKVPDRQEWKFDVFVAYSIEDIGWVKEKLMPVLEGKDKLKLCIHNRDFEVGKLIVDNIVDSVEKSRKIVIVLSNNFAKSSWCQFELNLVLRHMIESGNRLLVVVLLEDINQRYVTKSMRVMLQTTTYLEWGEDSQVKQAFYNRLRLLVKKPVHPTVSSRERKLSV